MMKYMGFALPASLWKLFFHSPRVCTESWCIFVTIADSSLVILWSGRAIAVRPKCSPVAKAVLKILRFYCFLDSVSYCDGTQGYSCWMSNCSSEFFFSPETHFYLWIHFRNRVMSGFIGKWNASLFPPKQRLLMHMKLWLWQTMTWMLRKSEQCPEYITLMVCNRTKGQVFPGTQITFSWFFRLENSLSFAKFIFWADTQFN